MKQISYYLTSVSIRSDGYSVEVKLSSIMHAFILYQFFERSDHHTLITR